MRILSALKFSVFIATLFWLRIRFYIAANSHSIGKMERLIRNQRNKLESRKLKCAEYNHQGFSLIEMVIALVVIGILVSIAIPSYQHHILNTQRLDGKTALIDLAARLERYYVINNSYESADLANLGMPPQSEKGFYQLQISSLNPTDYTLSARPIGPQQADTSCGTLTLNHLGEKRITGLGKVAECWS